MNVKLCATVLVLVCLLGISQGCAVGKRPFLVVQLCLRNEQNVAIFMDMVKSITRSEHIGYGDRSAVTQKEMAELKISPKYRVINLGWAGAAGVGWSASNIGLSAPD